MTTESTNKTQALSDLLDSACYGEKEINSFSKDAATGYRIREAVIAARRKGLIRDSVTVAFCQ